MLCVIAEEVDRLQHSPHGGLESVLGQRMEGLKSELCNFQQQMFQQSDGDCTPDLYSSPGIVQEMLERLAFGLSNKSYLTLLTVNIRKEQGYLMVDREYCFAWHIWGGGKLGS